MKKILLLVSMICMMVSMPVFAEETKRVISGGYAYAVLEDGTAKILKHFGSAAELDVPSELDGYAVTSIGENAFASYSRLSSITLPEGITSIGDSAFFQCTSLSSITLPDSIAAIGVNPFICDNISFSVSPDHSYLAVIDGVLFSKPDKRLISFPDTKEDYSVPNGIKIIGDYAFFNCKNLSNITLPEGITSIGDYAFSNCWSLSSITLPEGITSIGDSVFGACTSLSSITLPEGITSVEDNAFISCTSLSSITLLEGVTSIGDSAFANCTSLSSITLPESITSIGDSAFCACTSLSSITLPEGLTSIGDDSFSGCNNMTITVNRDSFAAEYCKEKGLNYTYPDANDWLNN